MMMLQSCKQNMTHEMSLSLYSYTDGTELMFHYIVVFSGNNKLLVWDSQCVSSDKISLTILKWSQLHTIWATRFLLWTISFQPHKYEHTYMSQFCIIASCVWLKMLHLTVTQTNTPLMLFTCCNCLLIKRYSTIH